jgi:hypothetical protein
MSSQDIRERPNDKADEKYLRIEILDVLSVSRIEAELQQPPCEEEVVPPEEPVFVDGTKPDKIECQQQKADNVVKVSVSVDLSIVTDVRTHPCVAHSIPRSEENTLPGWLGDIYAESLIGKIGFRSLLFVFNHEKLLSNPRKLLFKLERFFSDPLESSLQRLTNGRLDGWDLKRFLSRLHGGFDLRRLRIFDLSRLHGRLVSSAELWHTPPRLSSKPDMQNRKCKSVGEDPKDVLSTCHCHEQRRGVYLSFGRSLAGFRKFGN